MLILCRRPASDDCKSLTLKLPDKLQPYGLYVYYVVHICDFGMLRVKWFTSLYPSISFSSLTQVTHVYL